MSIKYALEKITAIIEGQFPHKRHSYRATIYAEIEAKKT